MSVALVSAARNEGPHLLEWIAWHGMIGFDPIIVYDNGSTDQTTDVLARLAAIGAVEHVLWQPPRGQAPQQSAFADALARLGTGWVAFFDIDEYLLLHRDRSIDQFVEAIAGDAAGIALCWQIFGSGGAEHWEPNPTVERFTRCASPDWEFNAWIKSMVRAERVVTMAVHGADLDGYYVNDVGTRVKLERRARMQSRSTVRAQLNHYMLRSQEEYAAKIARGRGSQSLKAGQRRTRPDPPALFSERDRNEHVDLGMLPHVPELKLRMERLRQEADIPPALLALLPPHSTARR